MPPWTSLAPAGPGALQGSWWFGRALPFSTVSATTRQVRKERKRGGLLGAVEQLARGRNNPTGAAPLGRALLSAGSCGFLQS